MTDDSTDAPRTERTEESVVEATYMDLERGEMTVYLEPGETVDLPADRVEVVALD